MKTLRDELNDCILEMQATSDKMKTLLMRDDIVWPELDREIIEFHSLTCDGCIYKADNTVGCLNPKTGCFERQIIYKYEDHE